MPVKPQQRREYREICKRLVEWRERAKLSQRQLSRKLGRAITFASKVESCVRRIDPAELADWARACDVPSADVLQAIGLEPRKR
ncbi:MAG: helix-turn-helix domain-containing protein [Acidobacteriales bacterium]|nr:helix-turn-helix domain-containing protein [Terriglobales bacterium]